MSDTEIHTRGLLGGIGKQMPRMLQRQQLFPKPYAAQPSMRLQTHHWQHIPSAGGNSVWSISGATAQRADPALDNQLSPCEADR